MIRPKLFTWVVFLSVVGGTIGITSIVLFLNQASTEPNPVESLVHYDFGPVHLKQMLRHTFNLANPFDETLQVTNVRRSCGCGAAKLGTSEIQPHGSTSLDLSLPAPDKQGKIRIQTMVLAKTNKTGKPFRFIFVIEAQPSRVIEVQDSYPFIQLGQIHLDDLPITKILAVKKGRHPMEWDTLECRSYSNNIVATLLKTAPEKWKLNLELKNAECFGDIRSHLEFSFSKNGESQPYRLVKPMQVSIAGPIVVSPNSILIGAVQPGEEVKRNIRLISAHSKPHPIEIISVGCPDNEIKVGISGKISGQLISIVFVATGEKGPRSGSIFIKAKADKIYLIQVRYLAYVLG